MKLLVLAVLNGMGAAVGAFVVMAAVYMFAISNGYITGFTTQADAGKAVAAVVIAGFFVGTVEFMR